MKFIILLIGLASFFFISGCATAPEDSNSTVASGNTITYEVFGMDCPGCHGGLEKNLLKVPGVTEAAANWKEQRVTLLVDNADAVSEAAINQAVEESNFTLGKRTR